LQLFSFGGYELALAAFALVVFGAYDSYPILPIAKEIIQGRKYEGKPVAKLATHWNQNTKFLY